MGLNLVVPCDWYLTEHVFWTEQGGGGTLLQGDLKVKHGYWRMIFAATTF